MSDAVLSIPSYKSLFVTAKLTEKFVHGLSCFQSINRLKYIAVHNGVHFFSEDIQCYRL